ncbi:hypothetical protein [Mycobacterium xenopi]|nr:hypothetical protein [Mycobacterium xenopi]MDA3638545.1 hypothetical protein [Mycobacterium xenopi]MDA3656751.1 hypothetical protein [Mycobacterium xenopi]MDA3661540.1 hypothetical protein [Mycobacterium xenopi]
MTLHRTTRQPSDFARHAEDHPTLPAASCERVSGYGVMGLPFRSGHVLGLRRWTASSIGAAFTSIWHRYPDGSWTFYESTPSEVACSRYFGADVQRIRVTSIGLDWEGPRRLRIHTCDDAAVDWTIDLGSTPVTRAMSLVGSLMPTLLWRSRPVLSLMGHLAGPILGVGKVGLSGQTSNGQHFDANPLRIWYVSASRAVVEGEDLGPVGPLAEQARMADFYFPQRGIFAVGRVFVKPSTEIAASPRLFVKY